MPRKYPPRKCANPECGEMFTPNRRNHIFCTDQCRINFNNDKSREKNLTDYALEKDIRKNEKILKKCLLSPYYTDDQINMAFLVHDHFNFKVSSDNNQSKETDQVIRWSHTHGIELKNTNPKTFTIHKREKTK